MPVGTALALTAEAAADWLIQGLRASADPVATLPADSVQDVLVRVGVLADLVPGVAELDLKALVVTGDGCVVLVARVHVRSVPMRDLYLRYLKN
ncbi:hypothetical protein [Qaidamihabitans albus]|uniref:hypothetical protein n=1 Tax=Qaidamihabitans albus TaxID=2795733 RepID=UPI0018F16CC8|nr:hypothetical protein [Qaidamihabitans albus]